MQQFFDPQEAQRACGRKHGGGYIWNISWNIWNICKHMWNWIKMKKSMISKSPNWFKTGLNKTFCKASYVSGWGGVYIYQ